jgi:cardiolipin synthase
MTLARGSTHLFRHPLVRAVAAGSLAATLLVGPVALSPPSAAATPSLTTTVEPAAGYNFLDVAAGSAKHTLDLSMYELVDTKFEAVLGARAKAGVRVRVLLDTEYGIKSVNTPAANYLRQHGVKVVWAPDYQIFHAKYLVVDDAVLYVGTGNLTSKYYSSTRDFWITDRILNDVTVAEAGFSSDFTHKYVAPKVTSKNLIWSPGATSALVSLINSAKHTLLIENEEMDSSTIESALDAAAQRHVNVEVVMTKDSDWTTALRKLVAHGVHVHLLSSSQVYIHAKVICADCTTASGKAFVGSQNFSTSSLDYNRELGIITTSLAVVEPVRTTVSNDFAVGSATL